MFLGANPKQSDYPLNEAYKRTFRNDLNDALRIIPPSQNVKVHESINDVRDWVKQSLSNGVPIVYTTGGWEGSFAHIQTQKWIEDRRVPVLLGLEQSRYIETHKNREPLTSLEERIKAWLHLAPPGNRIFLLPEGVDDYDEYAKEIGVFKRAGIYHLADTQDSAVVASARANRCYSARYLLKLHFGSLHTSDYK